MPLIDSVPHPRCPHTDTSPSLYDGSQIVETYPGLQCSNDGRLMPLIDSVPHPRCPHIGTSPSLYDVSQIVETYPGRRCSNDGRLMPLIDIVLHPRCPHIGTLPAVSYCHTVTCLPVVRLPSCTQSSYTNNATCRLPPI
jgi:hypothetical protein